MSSKSAKKNQRRREKRKGEKLTSLVEERKLAEVKEIKKQTEDPVAVLKAKLAEAKAIGDTKLAAKLRQDLWVLQDASSGVTINMHEEEVKESMERIQMKHFIEPLPSAHKDNATENNIHTHKTKNTTSQSDKGEKTETNKGASVLSPLEKEIRKLRRKIEQVQKLKKMQCEGECMEESQLQKIQKENEFLEELAKLEKQLSAMDR